MRRVGPVRRVLRPWWYRYRFGELGRLLHRSQSVPNFSEWDERIALYHAAASLPPDAVVLEIGCFLGATTIMLAGARRAAGSGVVHAVDPFDARGDAYSAPIYASIARGHPDSLRGRFEAGLRSAGVADLVVVHEATAETLAPHWDVAIDMLYLGGDQSVAGARRAFDLFEPHLKVGGVIALQNTREREYRPDHDGNHRLRKEAVVPPRFAGAFTVDNTTIARKVR